MFRTKIVAINDLETDLINIIQKNNPQYLSYIFNLKWREKTFKPNYKKHMYQRAKIVGNTIYLDSNFETVEKRNEVALHELAHYIVDNKFGLRANPHDEKFFYVLSQLSGKDMKKYYSKKGVKLIDE